MTGRKVRFLTITDEFTRESLAIHSGWSIKGQDVARVLEQVIRERGTAPAYLRSDNGPEFIALALRGFLHRAKVQTAYIDKGSPWQNGFAESFHSRFRDEFLNQEVFLSLIDVQTRTQRWRHGSNLTRLAQRVVHRMGAGQGDGVQEHGRRMLAGKVSVKPASSDSAAVLFRSRGTG